MKISIARRAALILMTILMTMGFGLSVQALDGKLQVTQDSLRILRDDGFKTHFYKGTYAASLSFKDQRAYLTLVRKEIVTSATVKFPAGVRVPANGNFLIDGTKTGQTFLIDGNIQTVTNETPQIRESESCSYSEEEYVCRGRGRSRICDWETVWYNGLRDVEYFFRTTRRTLQADLNSDNGGKAVFQGTKVSREKIFTYVGSCF